MLQDKVKCFENNKNPDDYFKCIDNIEEIMAKNSKLLEQKFGTIDV